MITIVDTNEELIGKVREHLKHFPVEGIEIKSGDIFAEDGLIVSASNPKFTMSGGLDAAIKARYPEECAEKFKVSLKKKGVNERIGNVIFTVTVGDDLKATRELVLEALEFALTFDQEDNVLIPGLGTGIGGLDHDEFCYCLLVALSEHKGLGWGVKFATWKKESFTASRVTGKTTKYVPGKASKIEDAPDDGKECGHGLHLGKSFVAAGNYHKPETVFFCTYEKKDLRGEGTDKVRVRELRTVTELPLWMGYGTKAIFDKLGKPIDAESYNPYQAETLPPKAAVRAQVWDQVWDQVRAQVWAQVGDQVGDQVRAQVWDQVWDQVGDQVRAQVWDQVGDQVRAQVWAQVGDQVGDQVRAQVWDQVGDQVGDQVWDQVWDQVRAQVWATSYWAVGVHFDLKITHWFADFLKLGVMMVFVKGKVKFFGKKGKYLGEYDEEDLFGKK